ncbi:MAG TPA: LPS assembly protein LptD, partial [Hyphomicrobiaceae bacterium]|nr:LPS assembly protein LptD [Hyphomicrobiaceae bacterium]
MTEGWAERTAAGAPMRAARLLVCLLAGLVALVAASVSSHVNAQQPDPPPLIAPPSKSAFAKPKDGLFGKPKALDNSKPLLLNADELIYDTKNNRVIARGNVEAYYNDYILTADQIVYDQTANTLTAEGNALLKEPNGNVVRGQRLIASVDFTEAFVQSLSIVARDDTRIVAERATRRDGNVSEYERAKFTPCKSDGTSPPLWCLSAARIVHDQRAATLTYQDAQFELFGVPILYMPYFQHADPTVKRRTGFLLPEIRHSTQLGYQIEVPYFFALAPNYDFLFHPLYTSKQGILWQGDWRHRVQWGQVSGQYTVKLAGIDQDDQDERAAGPLASRWRGSLETKALFSLSSWWSFGWDVTLESDDSFRRFYKLDSILQTDRVNSVFLVGLSERNYFGMHLYHFGGLLLDDTPHAESRVHPVIDYDYVFNRSVLGGEMSFSANALSLSRSDGTDMTRGNFEARWRRQIIDGIGQVFTPYLAVRGDLYRYTNYTDPNTLLPVPEDSIARAMGTAAMTYAYPFVAHTHVGSHVVEPTAQIIYRPARVTQRVLPDEDARSLIFDDTLLFDYDKFSGWDRIETGTRANVGLNY